MLRQVDSYPHIASCIGWSFNNQGVFNDGSCYLLLEYVEGGCVGKTLHKLSERDIVRV